KDCKPTDRREDEHDQDPADRSVAGEEQLDLELPSWAVSFMNVSGPRRMCRDSFSAAHPETLAPRQALKGDMLVLALPHRRGLQGLPEGLMPISPVGEVREDAQREPRHEDEGRVRNVFEEELREHRADEQRTHEGKDGDAVATEFDIPRHPVRAVQGRLDET